MKRILWLGLLALSGCVSAPPAIDPYAGLRASNPVDTSVYKSLSVAVFVSKNTENTLAYALSHGVARSRGPFGAKIQAYIAQLASEFIPRQFKSAVKIERLEDAAATHADVVVILDVRAEGAIQTFKHTRVDVSLIFMTPDGRKLDAVAGAGDQKLGFPDTSNAMGLVADTAISQAQHSLETAFYKSAPLLTLARGQGVSAASSPTTTSLVAVPPRPNIPASDVDALPETRRRANPKAYAVVVGIERYRESLPAADFAETDARITAEYFKRVLGVPEENLALLVNDHATKSDFEKYFERWLPNHVDNDSEVFVYFSGHGAPNPKTGDAYLVPFDADPTYIDQTGYSIKRMYQQLAKLPARKSTIILDSCFSGAGGRSVIAQGARPLVTLVAADVPRNLTVISASGRDQISNSYREKGHGLFTYFFLRALKDKGSDLRTAYDYLKPEVERIARRQHNADQIPDWQEGR